MSEAVLAPPFEMDAHDEARAPRATLAAVALVSFASLLLELSLTRLFSVVLFYNTDGISGRRERDPRQTMPADPAYPVS